MAISLHYYRSDPPNFGDELNTLVWRALLPELAETEREGVLVGIGTILDEKIPYNPLHDQGYPSIGCWPCTRAVAAGETDERAGRWSGMKKTECGLHTVNEQDGSGI